MPFSCLLTVYSGMHKYDIRYVNIAYTPVKNCKLILDFKSFKIRVLYGPSLLHMIFVYVTEKPFFSTHHNALPYCSPVTPHSSKISDNVTSDKVTTDHLL